MISVSVTQADAIRAAYERGGELAAAVELRQRFPGIFSNAQARECARIMMVSMGFVARAQQAFTFASQLRARISPARRPGQSMADAARAPSPAGEPRHGRQDCMEHVVARPAPNHQGLGSGVGSGGIVQVSPIPSEGRVQMMMSLVSPVSSILRKPSRASSGPSKIHGSAVREMTLSVTSRWRRRCEGPCHQEVAMPSAMSHVAAATLNLACFACIVHGLAD